MELINFTKRQVEACGIFIIHGPADAISTIAAYRAVGIHGEINPIVVNLLKAGEIWTIVGICGGALAGAILYPFAANSSAVPQWIGKIIILVGVIIVGCNVLVISNHMI